MKFLSVAEFSRFRGHPPFPVNEYDRKCDFNNPYDIIGNMNGENFCTNVYCLWSENDKENKKREASNQYMKAKFYMKKLNF